MSSSVSSACLYRHVFGPHAGPDAGIVHQDADRADLVKHVPYRALYLRLIRNVHFAADGKLAVPSDFRCHKLGRITVSIGYDDGRAGARKGMRRGAPDPAARAGYERRSFIKTETGQRISHRLSEDAAPLPMRSHVHISAVSIRATVCSKLSIPASDPKPVATSADAAVPRWHAAGTAQPRPRPAMNPAQ